MAAKRRRRARKRFSFKTLGLALLFVPLALIGFAAALCVETGRAISRATMRLSPPLWRATLGRWKAPRGNRFEDYSERRVFKDESQLLPKDALGLAGERLVFDRLRADPGARIVACNVENYYCELDVIYRDLRSREIAFVEVKTRRRESELRPTVEAVDARRRKKIALAARRFVRERGFADLKRRYDIAVVLWSESAPPEIAFYKGAFREEDALSDYRDDDFGKNRFAQTE